jgi:3'-phosphoadenosine 5'-phosphosulfate sulfotransferase (PAPS reductase)/FAD synthetase
MEDKKFVLSKYTNDDLKQMQAWDLERKVLVTQTRILEWYKYHDGKAYVSFSGGKDSTVLADITAQVCQANGYKLVLWFSDTGLEFPEIKEHVKAFTDWLRSKYEIEVELVLDYPKDKEGKRISFRRVIEERGYPLISKNVAHNVSVARRNPNGRVRKNCFDPNKKGQYAMYKWSFLLDAPFEISEKCCDIMKKIPSHKFSKETGMKPIVGTMACESLLRRDNWFKTGCNAFDMVYPKSMPLSFWTEQDVLKYISAYKIPIASVYGEINQDKKGKYFTTGYSRTGCVWCGFGCHLEKEPNRFQQLKETHPKLYDYCMRPWDEGGLEMDKVLNYINVKH